MRVSLLRTNERYFASLYRMRIPLACVLVAVLASCAEESAPLHENAAPALPNFTLTDAAYNRCVALMAYEDDPRAVLMISKGETEIHSSDGTVTHRSGWSIVVVNREQWRDYATIMTRGLEILLGQQQHYSELNNATLDYQDGWWAFDPEPATSHEKQSIGAKRYDQSPRLTLIPRTGASPGGARVTATGASGPLRSSRLN